MNENELMQKLMHSKKIMDVTDERNGGISKQTSKSTSRPMVEDFDMPQVKYNIPQEFLQEQPHPQPREILDFHALTHRAPPHRALHLQTGPLLIGLRTCARNSADANGQDE